MEAEELKTVKKLCGEESWTKSEYGVRYGHRSTYSLRI